MAEEPDTTKPGDADESKLELPKLSFRRRRKQDKAAEEPPPETVAETPVEAEAPPPPEPEPPAQPARVRKERKAPTLPPLSAPIASVVTGVVVGLVIVGLTFLSSRGCELVRGSGSCGAVGLPLLIAIMALGVLLGAVLLKAWQVSDPMSSSFLAVGLVAVLAMLFLLPSIDEWWMVIVIPALGALTFLLAWWVTRTFIDTEDDEAEEHGGRRHPRALEGRPTRMQNGWPAGSASTYSASSGSSVRSRSNVAPSCSAFVAHDTAKLFLSASIFT